MLSRFIDRLLVAFDATAVSGGLVHWGLSGPRMRGLMRVPLEPGVLVPSPFEDNLKGPERVREALRELREGLGDRRRRATVILPDGLARLSLLETPQRTDAAEYARFRLAQSSPYPAGEAVVSSMSAGQGRQLAAAVRRDVVAAYEAAVADAGIAQGSLSLAPFAALRGLESRPGSGSWVSVILGDVAICLAVSEAGRMSVFRNRRRDPGPDEPERLAVEIERTARLAGLSGRPRTRVVGPGAGELIGQLVVAGWAAEAGWPVTQKAWTQEAIEQPWLGAAAA